MPPTSFAETTMERDEETELANETVEDEESILSECVLSPAGSAPQPDNTRTSTTTTPTARRPLISTAPS
jgi:hypothetical protein